VARRGGQQAARRGQFIGDSAGELAVEVEDGFRLVEGMEHHPPQHERPHRVQLILEGRDDTEVPATAAHTPEEVSMLGGARGPHLAIGRDDVDRDEVIGREAVLASQPAYPAAQGQARNAGIRAGAPGGGQTERLGLMVEVDPLDPPFSPDGAPAGVDTHTAHPGQVNHEPPIAHRGARDIVAATPDRHQEMVGTREIDGLDHIGDPSTAGDERRPTIDHAIPDGTGLIVARVARAEQGATHTRHEALDGGLVKHRVGAAGGGHAEICHSSLLPGVGRDRHST
jgi:hypothetical protein